MCLPLLIHSGTWEEWEGLTFLKLPSCAKCQRSIFRKVPFELPSDHTKPASNSVSAFQMRPEPQTQTARLDTDMVQNILWFSLQLSMTWSILWALPRYWFLSGIGPWMQQPETARIRGTYCLYPALVRAPISGVCLRSRCTFYLHRSNVSDFIGLEFNCGRGIIEL